MQRLSCRLCCLYFSWALQLLCQLPSSRALTEHDDKATCLDESAEALAAGGTDSLLSNGLPGSRRIFMQLSSNRLSGSEVSAADAVETTGKVHKPTPKAHAHLAGAGPAMPATSLASEPVASLADGTLTLPISRDLKNSLHMLNASVSLLQAARAHLPADHYVVTFFAISLTVVFLTICMVCVGSAANQRGRWTRFHSLPTPLAQQSAMTVPTSSMEASSPSGRLLRTMTSPLPSVCSLTQPRTSKMPSAPLNVPQLEEMGEGRIRMQAENHFIGTPIPAASILGPVQYTGTPVPSSPLPALPTPPAVVNPKRFCPQLCPGLVVPRGSECVLAVQPLPPGNPSLQDPAGLTVEVLDLRGKPVLRAQVARPLFWNQVDGDTLNPVLPRTSARQPAVMLRMLQPVSSNDSAGNRIDSSVLAMCRDGETADGRRHMFIFDAKGRLFGRLAKDPTRPRYNMVSSRGDCGLVFDGLFSNHAVLISNEHQEQLADAEPCNMAFNPMGKFYRLRVASGVDVGLMLCGLVAIDEMEESPPCKN
mmetsp:Transcript_81538/g.189381  ORF Transcript_81538/g.189381 Transcript_81538/m.189381 type:complete len:535 (+) Transcript_81538:99-1703(+)